MKTLIVLLASAALLTSSAQTNRQNRARGNTANSRTNQATSSNSSSTNNSTQQSSNTVQSATTGGTNQLSFDQAFLRRATADSLLEVQLGQLALTNSDNPVVQDFGALLITDHTNALLQAQDLADEVGVTLPTTLTPLQQQQVQGLAALTGTAFDQAFANFMILSHILDIRLFLAAAQQATNADVQSFSLDQLPVLMEHLLIARAIRDDLLAAQAAGTGP